MKSPSSPETDNETTAEQKDHVHALLAKMSNVMFVTHAAATTRPPFGARPLHVAKLEEDGDMWFVTGLDTQVIGDLRSADGAFITAHEGSRWIHLSGRAEIVLDLVRTRELWSTALNVQFPAGAMDPNVVLIRFRPEHAEYWDTSGIKGIKYFFEAAKALARGTTPAIVKGSHGEVGPIPLDGVAPAR